MTQLIAVDTCVALWLAQRDTKQFSGHAYEILQDATLFVPAFVRMELTLMHQKGRVKNTMETIISYIENIFKTRALAADIKEVCKAAYPLDWTRDPFDRLIIAECIVHRLPLMTKDREIRRHYSLAVW